MRHLYPSHTLSFLSLASSNCKKCKENFFSLVSSESSVLREEHENAPFSLDKKKKKRILASSGAEEIYDSILCIIWMLLSPIEEHVESSIDGGGIGRYRPLEQSETTSLSVARFRVRNAKHAASLLCTRHFNQLVFVQSARYPRISDHRWPVGIVRLYRQRDQIIRERADTLE